MASFGATGPRPLKNASRLRPIIHIGKSRIGGERAAGDASDYRPNSGLYRGIDRDHPMLMGDDWVENKNASARKLR